MPSMKLDRVAGKLIRCTLSSSIWILGVASGFGQIATSTSVSLAPSPILQGTTPVASVTVTANDGSNPDSSVTCSIQARGHNASYAASLQGGVASLSLQAVAQDPVGSYTLACSYAGSSNYAGSSANPISFSIITQASTTTAVSVVPSSVPYGSSPVATVTVTASGGSVPTGSVSCNIQTRGHTAAYSSVLTNGSASLALTSIAQDPVGTYSLVCSYAGSAYDAGSTASAISLNVTQVGGGQSPPSSSSLALSSSQSPSIYGQTITLTATVSTGATGTVNLIADGGNSVGSATFSSSSPTVTIPVTGLSAGTHTFIASYSGDAAFAPATSLPLSFTINKATPAINWPTPAGIFYGVPLSATQLNATANVQGSFVYTPALGSVIGAGAQNLSVIFTPADSADYTTASQAVPIAVSVVLSTQTPAPYYYGQPLELIAQANASGTGSMTFAEDGVTLQGASTVAGGTATYIVKNLTIGQHIFTVSYSGDSANPAATGGPLSLSVQSSPTTTTVTLSPITSWLGYPVVANITVAAAGGTVPTAGGTIQCSTTPAITNVIPAASLDGTTTFTQVLINGLPLTPAGQNFYVVCSFLSKNTNEYTNSDNSATPALGTVVNAPTAINSAIVPGLITPRAQHQATLLEDGTVLLTGGVSQPNTGTDRGDSYDIVPPTYLQSTEIFNPNTSAFTQGAPMSTARTGHQATLLSSSTGQVLITGGYSGGMLLGTAELFTLGQNPGDQGSFSPTTLYDPSAEVFTTTPTQMVSPRFYHTATLLLDGTVLIAGGQTTGGEILDTAEIYDPRTGVFANAGVMTTPRWMQTATLLADGTVLIAGGQNADGGGTTLSSAEVYIPSTHQFVAVGGMVTARTFGQATLLGDGTVLMTGGASAGCGSGYPNIRAYCSQANAEIYTSTGMGTGSFASTVDGGGNTIQMNTARYSHTATVLYDGKVLISGGVTNGQSDTVSAQEIYDPTGKTFTTIGTMINGRYQQTATLLPNEGVLIAGGQIGQSIGYDSVGMDAGQRSAEVYGATGLRGGLYPKYMVLGVMYAPPGLGSSMAYNQTTMFGNTTSSTNTFKNGLSVGFTGFSGTKIVSPGTPSFFTGNYTYSLANSASYSTSMTTTNGISVPGPNNSSLGVDHESDIVWLWLNPATTYTAAGSTNVVWNGYETDPNDSNVDQGVMDIIPITVAQLDGTSPIPPELQAVLDRNWDPVALGGAGGLTAADFLQLLQMDPFATNLSQNNQRSTQVTNAPVSSSSAITIFDPNIPTIVGPLVQGVEPVCGSRYTFDPINGQTFPFNPLGAITSTSGKPSAVDQAITSTYGINSQISNNVDNATTNTYSVGLSASFSAGKGGGNNGGTGNSGGGSGNNSALAAILNSLSVSDTITFTNKWDPSKQNQSTGIQTLTIKSPLPTDNYGGPEQMQVWRDNLYGSYMFYPKPTDTVVTLTSSMPVLEYGLPVTLTATVTPAASINGNPTGAITFYDNCSVIGSAVSLVGTSASISTSWAAGTGLHVIRALYSGDANFFHNVSQGYTATFSARGNLSVITSPGGISPASATVGSTITISGTNLSTTGRVTFNGVLATNISSWTPTSIVVTVPQGATSGPVIVDAWLAVGGGRGGKVYGYQATNPVNFTVILPSANSTSIQTQLSPSTVWAGYTVVASSQLASGGGGVPTGNVSCVSSPSNGLSNAPGNVNPVTGIAQVTVIDLPQSPAAYTETCTYNPTGSFLSSVSLAVTGTVIPVPSPSILESPGLTLPRENHQATLLNDGTVLITGGDAGKYAGAGKDGPNVKFLQESEIYNGSQFLPAAQLGTARSLHQATLLSNGTGQVLITGGVNWDGNSGGVLASAELFTPGSTPGTPGTFSPTALYDPAAQAFTTTETVMNTPRFWHTATLLPNGKVLIAGGTGSIGNYNPNNSSYIVTAGENGTSTSSLNTAELYDPLTGKFSYTSNTMAYARSRHTATLLTDGTVLIAGGIDNYGSSINTAEIYNPATNTFTLLAAPMAAGRIRAAATRLGDGTVLITGGANGGACPAFRDVNGCARLDAEIYNPVSKTFTQTLFPMNTSRYSHTAVSLYNGTVLVSGGITDWYNGSADTDPNEEVYDPTTQQFTINQPMLTPRYNHTATLLPSNGVLIIGGAAGDEYGALPTGYQNSSPSAESFQPATQSVGLHPKYMVLNVMYAPPGSGSSITYSNSTQTGTTITSEGLDSNQLSISLQGGFDIKSVGKTGIDAKLGLNLGYTFAQDGNSSYKVTTTTSDSTVVNGPANSAIGVDHESDILWIWLNPENDMTVVTPSSLVWNGMSTNSNDPNVAVGQMDVVPLTVSQLDGTAPIPKELQAILDRDWDPVAHGGAGGLTASDFGIILKRDPFSVLPPSPPGSKAIATTLPTNIPTVPSLQYPSFDPNVPVSVPAPTPGGTPVCSNRYSFDSAAGQTFQYAQLGNTNQALSQSYSLQTTNANSSSQSSSDQYNVALGLGVCFGATGSSGCSVADPTAPPNNKGDAGASINLSISDTWTWGNGHGSSNSNQSVQTQALTIKNPLASANPTSPSYTGPVQMQVWQDSLYGTFMFYPKPTDTLVTLSSSQITTGVSNSLTLSASVVPDASYLQTIGSVLPSGTVSFYDGCTLIGTMPLVNGVATVSDAWAVTGNYSLVATYNGDANYFHNNSNHVSEQVVVDAVPVINPNGMTPVSGIPGTVVTVTGQNFGTSGVLTFNGVPATITQWTANSISASVPLTATTGSVVVATVDPATSTALYSNPVTFTVLPLTITTVTSVTLSPSISWSGKQVFANVFVTVPSGQVPEGTASCTISYFTNTYTSASVPVSTATGTVRVPLSQLPTVATGSKAATQPYNVACTFTSNDSAYTGSTSNSVGGVVTNSAVSMNNAAGGQLNVPREQHQANLLTDGTVLISGGIGASGTLSSAELYVAGSQTFNLTTPMNNARQGHQATLLANSTGQVLLTGGTDGINSALSSAELFTPGNTPGDPGSFDVTTLYDPTAKAFTSTVVTMNDARNQHSGTLLMNGNVLLAGGLDASGSAIASAEIYTPGTGNFTYTSAPLHNARSQHTAVLLQDGTVLIVGGIDTNGNVLASAEIYNPTSNSFTFTHDQYGNQTLMIVGSNGTSGAIGAQAVRLGSGKVLIVGGTDASGVPLSTAELYDPTTGMFTTTSDAFGATAMSIPRSGHTATLLYDNTVLITGGQAGGIDSFSQEIYDSVSGDFNLTTTAMTSWRFGHTATLLPNADILLAGGDGLGYSEVTSSALPVCPLGNINTSEQSVCGPTPPPPPRTPTVTILGTAELFSEAVFSSDLYPKYLVLNVLYAPPGAGSTVTYTDQLSNGTTNSTSSSFSSGWQVTASATVAVAPLVTLSPSVSGGHTFTQQSSSTMSLTTATTDTTVVPGPVSSGTASGSKISTGVDHESDIIQVWINPALRYTFPSPQGVLPAAGANPLIWNGYETNPNDPNVAPGDMDIVNLTVSQLDGTSPIPTDLQEVLDRDWDSFGGGAGGLLPSDFQTILARDPFATNLTLNKFPAAPNTSGSFFDPNIPMPVSAGSSVCSTRYSFDPVLGQTFPFGLLGSTNQPLVQTYQLQSQNTQTNASTGTDQYSVETDDTAQFGIPSVVSGKLEYKNTVTMKQSSGTTTNAQTTTTQALSIKNPVASDGYNGPTQMQVWLDSLYGTFMFYPKATDTYISLASSQSTADTSATVIYAATVTADPKVAALSNPPLVPTGTITFYDGCVQLGTPVTVNPANQQASISVSGISLGTHNILAVYSGDTNFLHNDSAPLNEVINNTAVAAPYIEVTPRTGAPGTQVSITGANLGSSGSVTFNGVAASATWTGSGISTTVPPAATSGPVVVTTNGDPSNAVFFSVIPAIGTSSITVTLLPSTTWSGYAIFANTVVTAPAGTLPQGSVSCLTSPSSTGQPTASVPLNAAGTAQVVISDVPVAQPNVSSVPFTVSCSFVSSNPAISSSSSLPVTGAAIPVPPATLNITANLITARELHQATLLTDSTVLITGGQSVNTYSSGQVLNSAELYLESGSFVQAATMKSPRVGHQATVLSNSTGQVLITGGNNGGSAVSSAELFTPGSQLGAAGSFQLTTLYDPAAQIFTQTPTSMTTARAYHTATLLNTGQVLIVGGLDNNSSILASAELYNPKTGLFKASAGRLGTARFGHSATLLTDGTVLIDGGQGQNGTATAAAEIYNPLTDTFSPTKQPMNVGRMGSQATRLGSGMVLITGGQDGTGNYFSSVELYNPAAGSFTFTKEANTSLQTNMKSNRAGHSAALLYDGTVLISGGQDTATDTLVSQEVYDPVGGGFSPVIALQQPRFGATVTTLPLNGVLIVGGEDLTASTNTDVGDAELYSPILLSAALHPKFKVLNILYAPPGSGSNMVYTDANTMGSSTGTENSFAHAFSLSDTFSLNLGIFALTDKTTRTWTNTQDSSSTFATNLVTTDTTTVPGPNDQALGVDHESDILWIWLNPVVDYTVTSPNTFVWNGFEADPDDPNVQPGTADMIPLSVSQLDGTSSISQAEWDILDRNWDPILNGGSGPITQSDFKTILSRDPFATNLSGVGRSTAPTNMPTGNLYPIFDPNIPTLDPVEQSCGNRYDFSPGFNMTFPYSQLGTINQALTQTYSLQSNVAKTTSSTKTDTYSVALSLKVTAPAAWANWINSHDPITGASVQVTIGSFSAQAAAALKLKSLTAQGTETLTWTDKWTTSKNSATQTTQQLTVKNPTQSSTDPYLGPEQIQVWKDNLYGTFMFYPKPSDTNWVLTASQPTVPSGGNVILTDSVTSDPHISAIPTGTVWFYDGCSMIGYAPVNVGTGTASITVPLTGGGTTHNIIAIYSGDTNFFHNSSNAISEGVY